MSQKYQKLKALLLELFQLDQPDLDFGIYRILHARSAEISQFLDQDLLPQVREILAQHESAEAADARTKLQQRIDLRRQLGDDPEQDAEVQRLRALIAAAGVPREQLEAEVYDHLYGFFRRYYSEGDFLSKRVYKPGVYAIPYEGEEVKLHWANADQYYIKTSEYLRDYAFRLRPDDARDPMRVHFRLVDAAEGEHGNVKEAEGKERRFKLAPEQPIAEEDGDLVIRFTYRPDEAKQKELNADAEAMILTRLTGTQDRWANALRMPHLRGDGSDAGTRLRIHLDRYSARNTFDYFIHKDLGGFLRRELDFYIKNEVMHLDDIESQTAPRVEQYLSKIKVIRKIAGKVIDFLAQIEEFQKKIWTKRKFVIETHWCLTLDRVPRALYPAVAENSAQQAEWSKAYGLDTPQLDLAGGQYTNPPTLDFLVANPMLVVDTRYFDAQTTERMLEAQESLSAAECGILIHSDNFHALSIMRRTYSGKVRCMYLDPPYNTSTNDFAYRDAYQHSSWISMMDSRLRLAKSLLASDAAFMMSIDDTEVANLRILLDEGLGPESLVAMVAYERSGSAGLGQGGKLVNTKEHVLVYSLQKAALNDVMYSRPIEIETIRRYNKVLSNEGKRELVSEFTAKSDGSPVRVYKHTGFEIRTISLRDAESRFKEIIAEVVSEFPRIFRTNNVQKENDFQNELISGMQKGCLYTVDYVPSRGRKKGEKTTLYYYNRELFAWLRETSTLEGGAITKQNKLTDHWSHGEIPKADLANEGGVALSRSKKPEQLVRRLLDLGSNEGDWVCDYFLGSGTTAAVAAKMGRKFIGIEGEQYFLGKGVQRLKNVLSGEQSGVSKATKWRGGGIFRYLALESYEDALSNLDLLRTVRQVSLLEAPDAQGAHGLREQYLLRYMLDVESRGSASLLNVRAFTDPTAYKLKVKRPGSDESREVNVDLIETFNWLIGLTVQQYAAPRVFSAEFERDSEGRLTLQDRLKPDATGSFWLRPVTGTLPDGRKALVVWRKLTGDLERDNLVLDTWFAKQGYSSKDNEFDLIYVNGSCNLENLKTPDDHWKVRLIEEDFHRLMFAEDAL